MKNLKFKGVKVHNIQTSNISDYILLEKDGETFLITPTEYILFKNTGVEGVLKRFPYNNDIMLELCIEFDLNKATEHWSALYGNYVECIPVGYKNAHGICKMANFLEFYVYSKTKDLVRTLESSLVMIIDEKYDFEGVSIFVDNCVLKDFSKEIIEEQALQLLMSSKIQKYKIKISS